MHLTTGSRRSDHKDVLVPLEAQVDETDCFTKSMNASSASGRGFPLSQPGKGMSVNNYDLLGKVRRSDLERSATRILRMIRQNTEVQMKV